MIYCFLFPADSLNSIFNIFKLLHQEVYGEIICGFTIFNKKGKVFSTVLINFENKNECKKIGIILLAASTLTVIIFVMDINFYNDNDYTKSNVNKILLLSFIKGLVISVAVNIANYYRSIQKK
ncbi:hypothetical protein [Chryseobacterium sp. MA9]|uniref:hypothetical protein n=1 Tax=Chryseobacterium sp. MA9 TaxID=2966625 RepID=UPI002105A6E7|nr:hypothetical protein [Chryseobacterium sp. MA9]UTX50776.1 hypothetical protein KIK00_11120 [Chryseobacterium sp. MA9]